MKVSDAKVSEFLKYLKRVDILEPLLEEEKRALADGGSVWESALHCAVWRCRAAGTESVAGGRLECRPSAQKHHFPSTFEDCRTRPRCGLAQPRLGWAPLKFGRPQPEFDGRIIYLSRTPATLPTLSSHPTHGRSTPAQTWPIYQSNLGDQTKLGRSNPDKLAELSLCLADMCSSSFEICQARSKPAQLRLKRFNTIPHRPRFDRHPSRSGRRGPNFAESGPNTSSKYVGVRPLWPPPGERPTPTPSMCSCSRLPGSEGTPPRRSCSQQCGQEIDFPRRVAPQTPKLCSPRARRGRWRKASRFWRIRMPADALFVDMRLRSGRPERPRHLGGTTQSCRGACAFKRSSMGGRGVAV